MFIVVDLAVNNVADDDIADIASGWIRERHDELDGRYGNGLLDATDGAGVIIRTHHPFRDCNVNLERHMLVSAFKKLSH